MHSIDPLPDTIELNSHMQLKKDKLTGHCDLISAPGEIVNCNKIFATGIQWIHKKSLNLISSLVSGTN